MKTTRVYIICFILSITGLNAQYYKVYTHLDTNILRIGNQAVLSLSIEKPTSDTSSKIVFPEIPSSLEGLEVVNHSIDTSLESQVTTVSKHYIITSFKDSTNSYQIPSLAIIINNTDTLYSQDVFIAVKAMSVDTSKAIYDIEKPLNIQFTFSDWLEAYWKPIVLGLGIIAIIIAIILYVRFRKKKEPVVFIPEKPMHEFIIEQLENLKAEKSWQKNGLKQFHTELSIITRTYIEKRFSINALEQTSSEILFNLKLNTLDEDDIRVINQTLNLSDLVKFAKEHPTDTQNQKSINEVITFVIKYKSKPINTKQNV